MISRLLMLLALMAVLVPVVRAEDPLPTAGDPDPARVPSPQAGRPDRISLSHILVAYKGASNADPAVARSKDEALARARQIIALARTKDGDYKKLARDYSDDKATGARGGLIGVVEGGKVIPALDAAGFALGVNQVSDPVETPFGFHILLREQIEEVAASHILLMYQGSMRCPPTVTRSKDEARKTADELLAKLNAGTKFEDLVAQFSDCPSKAQAGSLGIFGRGAMTPEFEKAAFALKDGEVSVVVETPFGFHIIRRDSLAAAQARIAQAEKEKVRCSHVLISYKGTPVDGPTRSKEEARALADKLLAELKAGKDFGTVARDNSDCPSKAQGGDLGEFGHGQMVQQFEEVAFRLKAGEMSGVIETMFGYHIILRTQ